MSVRLSNIVCPVASFQKQFSTLYNFKRHKDSVHLQIKNFKCQYCDRHLSSKQNLREHLFIHTGERPYKCDKTNCEQAFRQRCQLLNHKKIHEAILKFNQLNGFSEEKKAIFNKPKSILCEVKDQERVSPFDKIKKVDYLD